MQQGGTATFIGLQFIENNQIQLISCGDTNFFKISNGNLECFPYTNVDLLDANKHFINTEKLLKQEVDSSCFLTKTITYAHYDTLILATDALSRLFLKQPQRIAEFLAVTSFEQLHQFCLKYWDNKQLEEDDISAIVISIENQNTVQVVQPDSGFSFPQEEEKEFIPTPPTINPPENNLDMQEIRNNFNGIARDFNEVKKRLTLQHLLSVLIIVLLAVNIVLIYLYRPKNNEKVKKIEKISTPKSESKTIIQNIMQGIKPDSLKHKK